MIYIIPMFLLQITPDKAIDITSKVTPLTMYGYTFAVLVIALFAFLMYRRAMKAEQINETQAGKMLEFGMKMSAQLAANQQLFDMLKSRPEINRDILKIVEQNNAELRDIKNSINLQSK